MPEIKDHFATLELTVAASPDDIKKAYRRLARKYHPDINGEDAFSKTKFAAIKEAYEVLTTPYKKESYLQERWLAKSQGHFTASKLLTPENFLQKLIGIEKRVSLMDTNRSNYSELTQELQHLYSADTIRGLQEFKEQETMQEVLYCSIRIAEKIPHPFVNSYLKQLELLDTQNQYSKTFSTIEKKAKQDALLQKWLPWLAALLAIALILLIFKLA